MRFAPPSRFPKLAPMTGTIDVHTHHYPPEAGANPIAWGAAHGETHWAELVSSGPQGWADEATFLAAMEAGGVSRAVLLGWYWQRFETCREQNRYLARCHQAHPERWSSFASVQPRAGWAANEELLEEAREAGMRGIGEVHAAVQGFNFHDETWLKICAWANSRGWPISLHVTEPVGHAYRGRVETPLLEFVWLARQFPDLKFILAHWGGGLPFYMLNPRVCEALKNCFFDTAASPLIYSAKIWRTVVDLIGPEKILFGTDFPLRLYPSREKVPTFRSLRDELAAADLTEDERAAIEGGNARQLFA